MKRSWSSFAGLLIGSAIVLALAPGYWITPVGFVAVTLPLWAGEAIVSKRHSR